ncbi:hypothetical protein B0A50_06956 [Salinomyces thailandicus]|uniref:Polycomb protein VEFS-Box domain-containing protein n=1 Tax=Salinomyces thailandicus TaxID=706561 RepID=A0A4U0TQN5_9PEZI|nr:hypothetical protein B0A50_06956 [Salinomyces thailandica]
MITSRRPAGNAALYFNLARREPRCFLQRNITAALDSHAELARKQRTEAAYEIGLSAGLLQDPESEWCFPTEESLRGLLKRAKPALRIRALQLRLSHAEGSERWREPEQAGQKPELNWLPDPSDGARFHCQVHVSLSNLHAGSNSRRPVCSLVQQAQVVERSTQSGSSYFDVVLDQPLLIEAESLKIPSDLGVQRKSDWRRVIDPNYLLDVSIHCLASKDRDDFLSLLESRDLSHYQGRPASEGVLRASWPSIPRCPELGELLPLRRAQGHKSLELRYGVAIDMGWSKQAGTPLERHNRLRSSRQKQLPTPSSSDDLENAPPRPDLQVKYTFHDFNIVRAQIQEGLHCIWCDRWQSARLRPTPYKSLDRLMLHYTTYHDHFEYEVNDVTSVSGRQFVTIQLSVSHKPVSQTARDKPAHEEFSWTAPRQPFDIAAYVAGDESWTTGTRSRSKRGPGRPPKAREGTDAGASPGPAVKTSSERPNLTEVQEITESKRRKFSVPEVTGVKFYHATSKHEINADEKLSESDDELYDDRLVNSQRRSLCGLGMSEAAKAFHESFNRHMDAEHSFSTVLGREGIVRFAKKHSVRLLDEGWRKAFEEKLRHLRSHLVIDGDVLAYYLELRKERAPVESVSTDAVESVDRWVNGCSKKRVNDGGVGSTGDDGARSSAAEPLSADRSDSGRGKGDNPIKNISDWRGSDSKTEAAGRSSDATPAPGGSTKGVRESRTNESGGRSYDDSPAPGGSRTSLRKSRGLNSALSEWIANARSSPDITADDDNERPRKRHKTSVGRADEGTDEAVWSNATNAHAGSMPPRSPQTPETAAPHRAITDPLRNDSQVPRKSKALSRLRYVKGAYGLDDDGEGDWTPAVADNGGEKHGRRNAISAEQSGSSATDEQPASGRRRNAVSEEASNDRPFPPPFPLYHRKIEFRRTGSTSADVRIPLCKLMPPGINRYEAMAGDLDYDKFVTTLKEHLEYHPHADNLISRDPRGCLMPADNREQWLEVMRSWEKELTAASILFKIAPGFRVPKMSGLATKRDQKRKSLDGPSREARPAARDKKGK